MTDIERIAEALDERQKQAALEGRVHDCPYNHPEGTQCPNCAGWRSSDIRRLRQSEGR